MKLKFAVLFLMLMSFFYSSAAKYKYWLVIQDSSFVYKDSDGTKYIYPQKTYYYRVKTNSNIQGSGVGSFTIKITNGKKTGDTSTQFNVNENVDFSVQWNDIVDTCNVKIDKAEASFSSDTLNPISPIRFSYRIASLKGQTPLIGISSNPLIGTKQTITADIVTEASYPNLYQYSIYTGTINKTAEYYEWTLPPNWKAAGQTGSTFILGAYQKSITITPDYVTAGEIKVRALNALKTAGSDIKSNALNRGFNFTAFPTSITFGDNTAKTFSTTLFSGITYEWSVPTDWKINGQGNTIEQLNLNSVNVFPTFCSQNDSKVRVRLKKDGDVSPWYEYKNYQGVSKPSISAGNSTIYQYEEATFTINNINMTGVQSISCLDNNVCFNGNQGSNFKVTFLQTGTNTINVSILMVGCSTPVLFPITITVLPHRIKLNGPSQLCDQATYTIENMPIGAYVIWSTSRQLAVTSGQNSTQCIISKQSSTAAAFIKADVTLCGSTSTLTKTGIKVGTQSPSIVLYDSQGLYQMAPPYYTGTNYQIVAYGLGMTSEPSSNFSWSVTPPSSCRDCFTSFYNGSSFPFNADFNGDYIFKLKYYNPSECGWSDEILTNFYFNQGPITFSIFPNPATDQFTLKLDTSLKEKSSTFASTTTQPYSIELWNEHFGLVHTVICNESVVNIPLQNLPRGLYFIHLKTKDKRTQKKILQVK